VNLFTKTNTCKYFRLKSVDNTIRTHSKPATIRGTNTVGHEVFCHKQEVSKYSKLKNTRQILLIRWRYVFIFGLFKDDSINLESGYIDFKSIVINE
jgi:hypothetical protein